MNHLLVSLYTAIPKIVKNHIGKISWLSFFRNLFLKKGRIYRESNVIVKRLYGNYKVKFKFYASIKTAAKAHQSGIENTIINNSILILNKFKKHNNDCVVLDVGSNFGYLSLVWAQTISENNGKIIAFEPNKDVYKSLNKSISENNLNSLIATENLAVGNKNKTIKLYLDNSTSNVIESTLNKNYNLIEMVTIDSYFENKLSQCDLVKIDVDGIELDILEGSINILKQFRPIFIVETNNDKRIIEFFDRNDYLILDMKMKKYNMNEEFPLNIFCIPN